MKSNPVIALSHPSCMSKIANKRTGMCNREVEGRMQVGIHLTMFNKNSNACNKDKRNCQLIESKAFCRSIFTTLHGATPSYGSYGLAHDQVRYCPIFASL